MKILVCLALVAVTGGCALAQTELTGKEWNVTLKVIGEDGQPIVGANASVGYIGKPLPGQVIEDSRDLSREISGQTDENGVFTASHTDTSFTLGIDAKKDGYYSTHITYDFFSRQPNSHEVTENRNPTLTVVLKKIGKPIPMYAKWIDSEPSDFKKTGRPPISFNKSIGYDLTTGDWVAPYGGGQTTNIIFTEEFNKKSIQDFYYKLTISFPKTGDGIQEFIVPDAEKGSGLRSPHEAPADGYQPQVIRENYHRPGQTGKSDYDENRIYFFRTTLSDGLHYGKIYGDPIQMNFRYYLNPTPNDRNIEFDPKQNLLHGVKSFEQVTVP